MSRYGIVWGRALPSGNVVQVNETFDTTSERELRWMALSRARDCAWSGMYEDKPPREDEPTKEVPLERPHRRGHG